MLSIPVIKFDRYRLTLSRFASGLQGLTMQYKVTNKKAQALTSKDRFCNYHYFNTCGFVKLYPRMYNNVTQ